MQREKGKSTILVMLIAAFTLPLVLALAIWYINTAAQKQQKNFAQTTEEAYMLHTLVIPTPAVAKNPIDAKTLEEIKQIKLEEVFQEKKPTTTTPNPTITKKIEPPRPTGTPVPTKHPIPTPKPIEKAIPTAKILVVSYEPNISNKTIYEYFKWENALVLSKLLIKKLNIATQKTAQFTISRIIRIRDFPEKQDGFKYTPDTYVKCIKDNKKCHKPDRANYNKIFTQNKICSLVEQGQISEVWLWGGPYFGYPGYVEMVCKTKKGNIKVPVQGFNYERRDWEVHMFVIGMRIEYILRSTFSKAKLPINLFDVFSLTPKKNIAGCGTYYQAPNSEKAWDFDNKKFVNTYCGYFNSSYDRIVQVIKDSSTNDINQLREIIAKLFKLTKLNCTAWHCNSRDYYVWLYSRLPHQEGKDIIGFYKNWWIYIINPNTK